MHHRSVHSDEGAGEVWRPLGFDGDEANTYDVLVEGVPHWMSNSFWNWIKSRFTENRRDSLSQGFRTVFRSSLLRDAERACRLSVPYLGSNVSDGMKALTAVVKREQAELRLADFLLSRLATVDAGLDDVLTESGSAWRVGTRAGKQGLVRRVPEGVQEALDAVIPSAGRAGARLGEAWSAAFGIDPDPSRAYALAVKAVEDAAIPVVSPLDRSATLGKIITVVRDQGGWSLPMTREHGTYTSHEMIVSMMQTLWTGQSDRHGGDPAREIPVTQAAAECAVLLAVPMVHWFSAGSVSRSR